MRLFIALEPSPVFRDALSLMQDHLRKAGVEGKWLSPSNLHLTLAFIGAWNEDISGLLPIIDEPFQIALTGPGIFRGAKVLWAGISPAEALGHLAKQVGKVLDANGIPFDRKRFFPHITLARKPLVPDGLCLSGITVPSAVMTVREVCLYKSEHKETGMEYTVIGRGQKSSDSFPPRQTAVCLTPFR